MSILMSLSTFALRQLVNGACTTVGIKQNGDAVVGFLTERFTDHSQRLRTALQKANANAWKSLEIALWGDSLWERCKVTLARGEDKAFAQQVRSFLDATPLPELSGKGTFRQKCLDELRAARQGTTLTGGKLEPRELAQRSADFSRFADPQGLLEAEWQAVVGLAGQVKDAGFPSLGWLLAQRPAHGTPILVAGVRYFFRRAVEEDPKLAQGLSFASLEALGEVQEKGFAALSAALVDQGERLEELLGDVRAVVLDIKAEMQLLREENQHLHQAVMKQLEQHQLQHREIRPSDSLSIRSESERQLVKQLVARYRALPETERQQMPALLNAVGKLEVVTGNFDAAQRDFQQVATLVVDRTAQAEAHFNAYRTALERRDWTTALEELLEAVRLDSERFAPFPVGKYHPQHILGAGAFGVAFLCQHKYMDAQVVVKTLTQEDLEHNADQVFSEAQLLRQLEHPAIIRIADCGFIDADTKSKPFLVMDYFESLTLEEYVKENGPLPLKDSLAVAQQIAEGLQAAHRQGILHRDVKPANLLVRKEGTHWKVKIIDFGLAFKQQIINSAASTSKQNPTLTGSSIAGTLDYAPPEQMGRRKDAIGPYSDVYGFAKTFCHALFRTPQPHLKHWQSIPRVLAELLDKCLEEDPKNRPQSFAEVLRTLANPKMTFPSEAPGIRKEERPSLVKSASLKPNRPPLRELPTAEPVAIQVVEEVRAPKAGAPEPEPEFVAQEVTSTGPTRKNGQGVLKAPAMALLAVAITGALFNTLGTFVMPFTSLTNTHSGAANLWNSETQDFTAPAESSTNPAERVGGTIMYMSMVVACGLGILGAWHMLKLGNYRLALLGSFSVMYGGCLCCFAGLPVGIWSLMVLMKPEVKATFHT